MVLVTCLLRPVEHSSIAGSRRGEYSLSYLSDNDPSSLAVDADGQMARFVTKTLRVCSSVLRNRDGTLCLLKVQISFISQN